MKKPKTTEQPQDEIIVLPYEDEETEIPPLCARLPVPRLENDAQMKRSIAANAF